MKKQIQPADDTSVNHVLNLYSRLARFLLDEGEARNETVRREIITHFDAASVDGLFLRGLTFYQHGPDGEVETTITEISNDLLDIWAGWVAEYKQNRCDNFLELLCMLAQACFGDLAAQMHSPGVRAVHQRFAKAANMSGDLFMCVRRIKDLGEGEASSVTVVTNNANLFKEYLANPCPFNHGSPDSPSAHCLIDVEEELTES